MREIKKIEPIGIDASHAKLREIEVDLIDRNPENPRIIFRQNELEDLLRSIKLHGVQVPISVYQHGKRYVLIDGERRWRCCLKLNKRTIPALVQEKPDTLRNLLLMFNIHALREQWDLLTMAVKLPKIIELLEKDLERKPTEAELAERTGLSRGTIRRCRLLLDLPEHHIDNILLELKKPKTEQKLTEDFYIEMERALTTVERAMPQVVPQREKARDVLIDKFKRGVIRNRTDFRYLGKIARAERVKADPEVAEHVLERVFTSNSYSLEKAFEESVSEAYSEKDVITRVHGLLQRLADLSPRDIDDELRRELGELVKTIRRILA